MTGARWSIRGPVALGALTLVVLVGGLAAWGLLATLAGAVIAPGIVEVETDRQIVQHAEGGIVGGIHARDGDSVAAGDVVLSLDDTLIRSELASIDAQLAELAARRARLEAERDGADALSGADGSPEFAAEARLFAARRETVERNRAKIAEQVSQIRNQIVGAEAQLAAHEDMVALTGAELADQETLLERGLTQAQRVTTTRREAARLRGETGRLRASIAGLRAEIARLEIDAISLVADRREEAIGQLRDMQFREIELREGSRQLAARLARMRVRAPVAGIVHGSTVFVRDAVIRPGEPLMFIVPQDHPLVVTARVPATHVDQVTPGQTAALRFTAFDQRTTPEIDGKVIGISADALQDEATGLAYYRVRIAPDEAALLALEAPPLLPGMPVETHLRTEDRTPFAYLMKPLSDYFSRAMRES